MRVLVAGGGIGGLTAALCLHQHGYQVRVFERAPELGEVGAGLQIGPNGMHVFQALGLGPALEEKGFEPRGIEMRHGATGRLIFEIPLRRRMRGKFGAPYLHLHRADLHGILAAALEERVPGCIEVGRAVDFATQDAGSVALHFTDGSAEYGDIAVGADGIHSALRKSLFGPAEPRFTGCVAWRLTVPASAVPEGTIPPAATIWTGPGGHVVTYYLRGGDLINVVGVREQEGDWREESWTTKGTKEDLLADFSGWAAPVQQVLQAADPEACFKWALHDRAPLAHWSIGRVTLLGDACHPTLPFLAQGAVMAIEDAWVLAAQLGRHHGGPARALEAYEARRKARTARVQNQSRRHTGLYHRRSTLAQLATYLPMWIGGKLLPGFVASRADWLFRVDVTKE